MCVFLTKEFRLTVQSITNPYCFYVLINSWQVQPLYNYSLGDFHSGCIDTAPMWRFYFPIDDQTNHKLTCVTVLFCMTWTAWSFIIVAYVRRSMTTLVRPKKPPRTKARQMMSSCFEPWLVESCECLSIESCFWLQQPYEEVDVHVLRLPHLIRAGSSYYIKHGTTSYLQNNKKQRKSLIWGQVSF